MTIGIAASGENAGRAVLAALAAVEAVGHGAIGGFVSAVSLAGGKIVRGETQIGGTGAVRFTEPCALFETAPMAALISSGPNRPDPLSDFTLAAPGAGIVTGHRLPNAVGQNGLSMNRHVLELMAAGHGARQAIESVITGNPSADCGLAAIDCRGEGHVLQTPTASRPDSHLLRETRGAATVCVLHNGIQPHRPLAALALEIALETMLPDMRPASDIVLSRGCPVRQGPEAILKIDQNRHVSELTLPDAQASGVAVLNLGYRPRVVAHTGREGVLTYEPFVVAKDGRVVSVDGLEAKQIATGEVK